MSRVLDPARKSFLAKSIPAPGDWADALQSGLDDAHVRPPSMGIPESHLCPGLNRSPGGWGLGTSSAFLKSHSGDSQLTGHPGALLQALEHTLRGKAWADRRAGVI